ncbi:MAG: PepSY domain-containing protein [Methylococcaceae bacterium]
MKNLLKVAVLAFLLTHNCFAEDAVPISLISLDQATKQIIDEDSNRVLGAQTEIIDNKAVHVIKVLKPDGHIQYYKIDAETGELIN